MAKMYMCEEVCTCMNSCVFVYFPRCVHMHVFMYGYMYTHACVCIVVIFKF